MNETSEKYCWADRVVAADRAEKPTAEQVALLDHIGDCPPCSLALETVVDGARSTALDAERSAEIRERLVQRAANDRQIEKPAGSWLPAGSGWLVAAGLSSLLLTHHSFHQPLQFGWIAAAVVGVIALGLGIQAFSLHRQVEQLKRRLAVEKKRHQTDSDDTEARRR